MCFRDACEGIFHVDQTSSRYIVFLAGDDRYNYVLYRTSTLERKAFFCQLLLSIVGHTPASALFHSTRHVDENSFLQWVPSPQEAGKDSGLMILLTSISSSFIQCDEWSAAGYIRCLIWERAVKSSKFQPIHTVAQRPLAAYSNCSSFPSMMLSVC